MTAHRPFSDDTFAQLIADTERARREEAAEQQLRAEEQRSRELLEQRETLRRFREPEYAI